MYVLVLTALLLSNIPTIATYWSGIAVVGQSNNDGQIIVPDTGVFKREDNFGVNKTFVNAVGASCHCKFYVSGGNSNGQMVNTVYEADPRSDTNRLLTHMTAPREYHTMTCIDDDSLIICGGNSRNGITNSCEICHTSNPLCIPIFSMPTTLWLHASVFSQGHLYVIGGAFDESRAPSSHLYEFSPVGERWTQRASMSVSRGQQPSAISLTNGHILVCGGANKEKVIYNSCESYDPVSDSWTPRASMHIPRQFFALVRLEGRVYAVGSWQLTQDDEHDTMESYDEFYDSWTLESINLLPDWTYGAAGAIDHACVA